MKVSVRINRSPSIQEDAQWLRIKSSYELYGKSRPTYNNVPLGLGRDSDTQTEWVYGLPDVFRYRVRNLLAADGSKKPDTIELDENKQHWLLKVQVDMRYGTVYSKDEYFEWFNTSPDKHEMVSLLTSALAGDRSHTNFYGMDNSRNYLTGERMDMGLPKFSQIITGGSYVNPVLENGVPIKRNLAPEGNCVGFRCIKSSADLWSISPLTNWDLFEFPAISGRLLNYGKEGITIVKDNLLMPYPQFNPKLTFPLWTYADDIAWVPAFTTIQTGSQDKLRKDWVLPT